MLNRFFLLKSVVGLCKDMPMATAVYARTPFSSTTRPGRGSGVTRGLAHLCSTAGSNVQPRAPTGSGPCRDGQASWLTHWRSVDELHQITDAWNQVRTEKMWQRAPSGMENLGDPWGGAAAPTSAERQGSDPSEDLAWMASLPDDAQVQPDAGGREGGVDHVLLRVNRQVVSVRPSWITIVQDSAVGMSRLYASKELLTSNDVDVLGTVCEPFCTVENATFLQDDMPAVDLLRYYVGFVGDVGPTEEDILWPNQVLHRDRILFNVRSGEDIARFLSSPSLEAVLEHGENLRRIALERGYQMGWCWQMLRLRWGGATLADLKLCKADFV
ncbi:hypothetical protein ACKKBF_B31405 [Auxenochlorella protothecoides x Auxenochlorella symbiontica]